MIAAVWGILVAQTIVRFASPERLWLLLVIPVGLLLIAMGWKARRRARVAWAGTLFDRLAPGFASKREWLKTCLFLLAFASLVFAIARPQWGGETVMMTRRGIDIFVAIDTSTSMLAEDIRPNRLEQAKREVGDLVQSMGGDRIGLIAFAGEAFTVCPLTLDHATVLLLLESFNVNSVSTPGTNVGDAIRKARASFVAGDEKHKALLVVTDGESHEGDALSEAQKAKDEGLVIYAIGVGSPSGEPIPERTADGNVSGYKRDREGNVVTSKLDEATLKQMAEATGGRYYRGTSMGVELTAVLEDLQDMEKKELEGTLATSYEERFQWPLGFAVLLLALELVIPARRRTKEVAV